MFGSWFGNDEYDKEHGIIPADEVDESEWEDTEVIVTPTPIVEKRLGKLRHFKDSEFRCKCGCGQGIDDMDERILLIVDEAREAIGRPMRINSAVRCVTHNRNVGGVANSEHVAANSDTGKCTAVDIHIPDSAFQYALVKELYKHGVTRIGLNQSKKFIHVGLSKNHPQNVFFKY